MSSDLEFLRLSKEGVVLVGRRILWAILIGVVKLGLGFRVSRRN